MNQEVRQQEVFAVEQELNELIKVTLRLEAELIAVVEKN